MNAAGNPVRALLKAAWVTFAVAASAVLLFPLLLLVKIEEWLTRGRCERLFATGKELLAPIPTILGSYLRSTYYWVCCEDVHPNTRMLVGSMIAHRRTRIARDCVVGAYTIVGAVEIGPRVLIGARGSILSTKRTHRQEDGRFTPFRLDEILASDRVRIGADCWLGDQVVVMTNVPEGCTVGAGSVVYTTPPPGTTVLGNPARPVWWPEQPPPSSGGGKPPSGGR